MKLARLLVIGTALFALVGFSDQKPDFTGKWTLKVDQSDFGKMKKPVGMTLVSKREGGVLKSEVTTVDEQGSRTETSQWYDDGKEHPIQNGSFSGKEKTSWSGNTLVSEKWSDDGKVRQTVKLSLSSDGKTCTQKTSSKTTNGNTSGTLIWQRN